MVVTLALVMAAAIAVGRWPRVPVRETRHEGVGAMLDIAEVTGLGLSAGLTFRLAVADACGVVGGDQAREIATAIRRGESLGEGTVEHRLLELGRNAADSGAPLLPAIDGLIDELRGDLRQRQLEQIRKLPVKLLFPLALLILPGFLLLTVGPVVAGSIQRLQL